MKRVIHLLEFKWKSCLDEKIKRFLFFHIQKSAKISLNYRGSMLTTNKMQWTLILSILYSLSHGHIWFQLFNMYELALTQSLTQKTHFSLSKEWNYRMTQTQYQSKQVILCSVKITWLGYLNGGHSQLWIFNLSPFSFLPICVVYIDPTLLKILIQNKREKKSQADFYQKLLRGENIFSQLLPFNNQKKNPE